MLYAWMGKRVHLTEATLPVAEWKEATTLCGRTGLLYRCIERPYAESMCQHCERRRKNDAKAQASRKVVQRLK